MDYVELQDIERVAQYPIDWTLIDNKTIMISGGTGFIGSFLSDVIRYRNKQFKTSTKIISLSRRGSSSDGTVEHLKADIVNQIKYEGEIDYILHLASNTHPKQYGEDPVGTIMTNVLGCDNLLRLAVEKKSKFFLASSVEIYGQGTKIPMDEKYSGYIDCNTARSGYNEAKRTCEALCQSYKQQYGVEVYIARLSRVFGPDKKVDTKALSQFMDKAIAKENIILNSKGNQRFSYCYVADIATGIFTLLTKGINGEVYNISEDDDGTTLGGYAEFIASLACVEVEYQIENNVAASKASFALLDTSKIKALGWNPMYSVKEGMERTYNIKCSRLLVCYDG